MRKILITILLLCCLSTTGCFLLENNPKEQSTELKSIDSYAVLQKQYKAVIKNGDYFAKDFETGVESPGTNTPTSTDEGLYGSSQTNTQYKDVDEGDIVKNDDRFIYFLGNKKLIAIDTKTDEEKTIVDYTDTYKRGSQLFLYQDKLVVIEKGFAYFSKYDETNESGIKIYQAASTSLDEITLLRSVTLDGSITNPEVRIIDNYLYLIGNKSINISYHFDDGEVTIQTEEEDFYIGYRDSTVSDDDLVLSPSSVYAFDSGFEGSYTMFIALDLDKDEAANIKAVASTFDFINMNNHAVYTVKNNYNYRSDETDVSSNIYRFEVEGTSYKYKNSININGTIKDQFSLDEYDNCLRVVATINSYAWISSGNAKKESFVYTYSLNKGRMELLSSIGGIGINENVYSVRFNETKCNIVTFKTVDPLYVIDLTDPSNIIIEGELKVPGVSDYLHIINDQLTLGIGRMTEEREGFAVSVGFKISLFNVQDGANPIEKDVFEVKGAYSNIGYDHKSLMVIPDANVFGIPVGNTFYLFKIDVEKEEIVIIKEITHDNTLTRGVYLNDNLYTFDYSDYKKTTIN